MLPDRSNLIKSFSGSNFRSFGVRNPIENESHDSLHIPQVITSTMLELGVRNFGARIVICFVDTHLKGMDERHCTSRVYLLWRCPEFHHRSKDLRQMIR